MSNIVQAYILLCVAIVSEIIGSTFMGKSAGFSKLLPTLGTLVFYGFAFWLLANVIKTIPLGIAYAIWSGVGIVLTAIVGYFMFGNRFDFPALLGIGMIVSGVIVMNVFSKTAGH